MIIELNRDGILFIANLLKLIKLDDDMHDVFYKKVDAFAPAFKNSSVLAFELSSLNDIFDAYAKSLKPTAL